MRIHNSMSKSCKKEKKKKRKKRVLLNLKRVSLNLGITNQESTELQIAPWPSHLYKTDFLWFLFKIYCDSQMKNFYYLQLAIFNVRPFLKKIQS